MKKKKNLKLTQIYIILYNFRIQNYLKVKLQQTDVAWVKTQ